MQNIHNEFERLYGLLNPRQKEAVDSIEGPVMVIAGPGTGKTQILTLRIANILRKTDVSASSILALTFTNAGAANMRKRLVGIVGSEGYSVSIFTFHSFANHLLQRYPEFFGAMAGFANASEVEQLDIIRTILAGSTYERLAPLGDPYRNAYDIRKAIGDLKKEGYTPDMFSAWVSRERATLEARDDLYHTKGPHVGKMKGEHERTMRAIEKTEELSRIFAGYQRLLSERKRFDFDDSLLALIRALTEHESFLRELQEEYQYFLVDEHQDTNGAQNTILELLVSYFDQPNLFVVGDEKQAIFRFQGASLANFLYFEKKFRDVRRISLETNYRSTQTILDSAHSLISHARETLPAELTAATQESAPGPIQVYSFAVEDEELLFLADAVAKQIKEGVPAHEIAVFFRTNKDARPISEYFERLGIPFVLASGHGVLDDPDIRKLHLLLRAVRDLNDDTALSQALFIDFLGLRMEDVLHLTKRAQADKRPVIEVLGSVEAPDVKDPHGLRNVHENLMLWTKKAKNESFMRFFEDIVRESGLLMHIQASVFHLEKFDKLVRLFDEIKAQTVRQPFYGIDEYIEFLTIMEEHGLVLEAKSRQVPNCVRLMTAHKAKGLEFDYAYITGVNDGHWGNRRSLASFRLPQGANAEAGEAESNEDERRLFYVALTRARKQVYVSFAARSSDGRERIPSRFLEEIRPELKREITGDDIGVAGKRPPLFVPRIEMQGSLKYAAFIRQHFDERGLSATGLNNFLTCPWKWFYHNFFYMQFVPSIHQKRGTAVHAALQDLFNERNQALGEGREMIDAETFVLKRFTHHLTEADLEPREFERVLLETGNALRGYVRTYESGWTTETLNETRVRGVLLDDVLLSGAIDKLILKPGATARLGGAVTVVDYKTGKPKSRNEIEGKTKAPQAGNYYRQLVFYKLLLDRYQEGRFRAVEGVIDFIEPNERGIYKSESFELHEAEAHELSDTIRAVAKNIRSLTFWDTRCDDGACEECALRDLMEHHAK